MTRTRAASNPVRTLAALLREPAPGPARIVEIAAPPGRPGAHRTAPISGALQLGLDDFAGAEGPTTGRQPLPEHATLVATLTTAGISPSTAVIIIPRDASALSTAARGWVTLRWAGVAEVSVLHPDEAAEVAARSEELAAWAAASGTDLAPAAFARNDAVVATADEVATRDAEAILIDARSPDAFGGEGSHIAGAVNVSTAALLGAGGLTNADALRQTYREAFDIDPLAQPLIVSCGSGISASVQALALAQAGVEAPVYIGSWSEWSKISAPHPL
ncbi:sulfurtransferase [Leucobacter japonicus]|uniref:sulfurtransferase n=1 Tax=Leucobacter japonicus TaxID=1461259 RepID=UPI0006A7E4F5|nr:rhodanese-like domain-containing protein [Leucobacter japonicus]